MTHNQLGDMLQSMRSQLERQFEEGMGATVVRRIVIIQNAGKDGWVVLLMCQTRTYRWLCEPVVYTVEDERLNRDLTILYRIEAACEALKDRILGPGNKLVNQSTPSNVEQIEG